jgi:hypothetical protein
VSPPVVRRWLSLGLIPGPPWTREQLHEVRDLTDPEGPRRGNRASHGTMTRWNAGCSCAECRRLKATKPGHADGAGRKSGFRPTYASQFLHAIYAGKPFREALRDLGLTPNQVWGLTKIDEEWSIALDAALTTTRREDLKHGTNAAYVAGCVCKECREHQRIRMARNRLTPRQWSVSSGSVTT